MLRVYRLTKRRDVNWAGHGYDSYDSHIVTAATELEARALVPCGDECGSDGCHGYNGPVTREGCCWRDPLRTDCTAFATADDGEAAGVELSSFNAG